jgi:sec-independent protein translocase protein TatB
MFDFTSSKLFLLAIVALLVIGPKDFPVLLRTIGKYMGIIRGHAREFRAQFDEAMREAELTELKKDMESIAQETEATIQSTTREMEQTINEASRSVEEAGRTVEASIENPLAPASQTAPAAESAPVADTAPAVTSEAAAPATAVPVASGEMAPVPSSDPPAPAAHEAERAAERTGA